MLTEGTRWHRIEEATVIALPEGGMRRVMVKHRPLLFVRTGGRLYAMLDQCPHQGMSFVGGRCVDGHVVCPWHGMSFDPATGRNRFNMTGIIPVFPVEEKNGAVRVGLPYTTVRLFGKDLW